MSWKYDQSSGEMSFDGKVVATGYSGKGLEKNDPDKENIPYFGPIPRGQYKIGSAYRHQNLGSIVMNLDSIGHNALGRTLFRIHGDNATGTASQGCIIMPRFARDKISNSTDKILTVVK